MTKNFSIAHISDLHLSPEFRRQNIRHAKRLFEYIAARDVDHLVITGDIAADARPKDFEIARSILSSFGFLDPRKTTIIPGNHDIYGGVHTAEDVLEFPSRCRRTDLQRSLDQFARHFKELFEGCRFDGPGISYPFLKEVGPVVLLGMNSIPPYSVVKNPVGSNGRVSRGQIDAARKLLKLHPKDSKSRIVLIHHHFNKPDGPKNRGVGGLWGNFEQQTMKLWKKKRLFKFFQEEEIDVVLHGHLHANAAYLRKGVRFLNAGGSVMGQQGNSAYVNIIALERGRLVSEFQSVSGDSATGRPRSMREEVPMAIAS